MARTSSAQCENCGATLQGRWCAECGQKKIEDSDRRFGHVIGQFAHELLHIEGKLPRTLGVLLFKPGKLSDAWLQGQRVRYLSPIGLFLIINLIYFLAPPMTDFNLSLEEQYYMQPYSNLIQPMIDHRLELRQIEFSEYTQRYEKVNFNLAKSLIILHLPLLAVALLALFPRRRFYYAEHFIVATHLFTFLLVAALIILGIALLTLHLGRSFWNADLAPVLVQTWAMTPAVLVAHWVLALRRTYRIGWLRAVLTTLAALIALIISHFLFRATQFFVVFALS